MKKLLLNLQFIFRPAFWIRNYDTDKKWDKELNHMIDNWNCKRDLYSDNSVSEYTLTFTDPIGFFKPYTVWIKDYPYAYGYQITSAWRNCDKLPSRLTTLKLRKLEKSL